MNTSLLCLAVELDRALGHQEPHWKEFRFDLTQIPAGETVTAAEFRIYKLPSTHPLNRTLHVSMFEVVRERANRCLPRPASQSGLCRCACPALWGTFPRGQSGASWEHTPLMKDACPKALAPWLQAISLLSWLWDLGRVAELPSLSFPAVYRGSGTFLW